MENTIASLKEVQKLFSNPISDAKASRMISYTRDVLNKPRPKIITIEDVKFAHGLNN